MMLSHSQKLKFSLTAVLLMSSLGLTACERGTAYDIVPTSERLVRAQTAYDKGDIVTAEKNLEIIVFNDKANWKAQYLYGQIFMDQGKYAEAERMLRNAAHLRDGHRDTPKIRDLLAESLFKQNKHKELRQVISGYVKNLDEGSDKAWRDYAREGKYLMKIGDPDGAVTSLNKSHALIPKGSDPYFTLAELHQKLGNIEKVAWALRHAYYFRPNDKALEERMQRLGVVIGPATALKPGQNY